jgi:hypothetical protein
MIDRETPAEIADRIFNCELRQAIENTALVEKNREFLKQRIEQAITVAIAIEQ